MTPEAIAAGLTKAQRRCLFDMPDAPYGVHYTFCNGLARVKLFTAALLEYQPCQDDALPKMVITPLGLAVRDIITKEAKHEQG